MKKNMRQSTFQIKISLLLKCTFKYILMYMFFNCLKETFIKQTTDGLSFSTSYRKQCNFPTFIYYIVQLI